MPHDMTDPGRWPAGIRVPIDLNSDFHRGYLCAIMQVLVDDVSTVLRSVLELARAYGRESEPDSADHCFMFICNTIDTLHKVESVTGAAYFERLPTLESRVDDLSQ